jgi:hypothetical protein
MIIKYFCLIIILSFLHIGCQEDTVAIKTITCKSTVNIKSCRLSNNIEIVLDTFSLAQLNYDSLSVKGRAYLKYSDPSTNLLLKWKDSYIPMRTGIYEISNGKNNFVNVFSGGSRLEAEKLRIDIESGSQLKYISGNYVIIPLTENYPNWVPDTLIYK